MLRNKDEAAPLTSVKRPLNIDGKRIRAKELEVSRVVIDRLQAKGELKRKMT